MRRGPLWRCPKCRRWLPERNAVHACTPAVPVARHFRGKNPRVRQLYRALHAAVKRNGLVQVDSTKSRIAFRVWTNFVELTPQKEALRGTLLLPRQARHGLISRVIAPSPGLHYHYFRLTHAQQIDRGFQHLLAEAYKVGRREHRQGKRRKGRFIAAPTNRGAERTRRPAAKRGAVERPLWYCPKCGWPFRTRNLWHSCVRIPLAKYFQGKDPVVRKTFDALVAALRRNGPLTVITSKTRIAFCVRMRFGGVQVQKDRLRGAMLLPRPVRDPRFFQVISLGPRAYGHSFWLRHPSDIDARLRRYLAQAYAIGRR